MPTAKKAPVKKAAPPAPPPESLIDTETKPARGLRPTGVAGIFTNRMGVLVNAHGVSIGFAELRAHDTQRIRENLQGRDADTPADFLDSAWKDPRLPLSVRMDAAKASAPYRNQKLIGLSGVAGAPPLIVNYANDSDEELERKKALLATALAALGVQV